MLGHNANCALRAIVAEKGKMSRALLTIGRCAKYLQPEEAFADASLISSVHQPYLTLHNIHYATLCISINKQRALG
jgi:hypothetical protein